MSQPKTVKKKAGDGKGGARGARHRRPRGASAGGAASTGFALSCREMTAGLKAVADVALAASWSPSPTARGW